MNLGIFSYFSPSEGEAGGYRDDAQGLAGAGGEPGDNDIDTEME